MKKRKLALGMVPITMLSGSMALAQEKPAAPTAADKTAATAEADVAGGQLDKVTITTTKRATLLQETPLAVTAFSQRDLDKAQVRDLTSLQTMIPKRSWTCSNL